MTVVRVMVTLTVFTPCQSVLQQNMEHPHGIQNTAHQLLLLPLAVETMKCEKLYVLGIFVACNIAIRVSLELFFKDFFSGCYLIMHKIFKTSKHA